VSFLSNGRLRADSNHDKGNAGLALAKFGRDAEYRACRNKEIWIFAVKSEKR
jgi:hypothetical protein